MGWEYSDTDCKYADVCSFSPRCCAKTTEDIICYSKDNRNFWQKLFQPSDYNMKLRNEYEKLLKEKEI